MLVKWYKYIASAKLWILGVSVVLTLGLIVYVWHNSPIQQQQTIFILDVSHSMNTQDVSIDFLPTEQKSSRLLFAKYIIQQIIEQDTLHRSYGLIIFAQNAQFFIPPTTDSETFLLYLDGLTTNSIPFWWSNIAQSLQVLHTYVPDAAQVFVLSDFGDPAELQGQQTRIQDMKKYLWSYQWNWISIGSVQWGEVLLPDGNKVLDNGSVVISKRNNGMTLWLYDTLGGAYTFAQSYADVVNILQDNTFILQFMASNVWWIYVCIALCIFFILCV